MIVCGFGIDVPANKLAGNTGRRSNPPTLSAFAFILCALPAATGRLPVPADTMVLASRQEADRYSRAVPGRRCQNPGQASGVENKPGAGAMLAATTCLPTTQRL